MLKLCVCEDNSYMREDLERRIHHYIDQTGISASVFCHKSGEALLADKNKYDVILMDIMMVGTDGMETARKLKERGDHSRVIFVTSSRDYVLQAFDVEAVHYLIKPVSDCDLYSALERAFRPSKAKERSLTVEREGEVHIVYLKDILYCEAVDHKIYLYTKEGTIHHYGRLKDLVQKLDDRFFRCHRSYVVNLSYVAGANKELIFMTNGDEVLVSRRKQQEFTKRLLFFFRGGGKL